MALRTYREGDYLFICDQCGKWEYGSRGQLQWNNLFVCPKCFEYRHPQDFVYGLADDMSVPIARPRQTDHFLEVGEVTVDDL